jgi:hypothetical protein
MPVVNSQQLSFIYNPALRRLAMARVSYLVRLNSTLSFDAVFSLFTRLDTEILPEYWIYDAYTNKGATGFLLGEEFVLGALWTPFSDFSLNCALGFFFPDNGPNSVYIKEAPVKCDIRLGILISF